MTAISNTRTEWVGGDGSYDSTDSWWDAAILNLDGSLDFFHHPFGIPGASEIVEFGNSEIDGSYSTTGGTVSGDGTAYEVYFDHQTSYTVLGTISAVNGVFISDTLSIDGAIRSDTSILVGYGGQGVLNAGQGVINIGPNGVLESAGPHATNLYSVVVGYTGSGIVDINGGGALLSTGGDPISVGQDSTGVVSISNGGSLDAGNAAPGIPWAMVIGNHAGSKGILDVSGAGSGVNATGEILIGRSGAGTVDINDGAMMASILSAAEIAAGRFGIVLGQGAGGSGTLTVEGTNSTVTTNANINMGKAARLSLSNGGVVSVLGSASIVAGSTISVDATSAMDIGGSTNASNGTIFIEAGAGISGAGSIVGNVLLNGIITATNGTLTVGGDVTGTGALDIASGATLEISGTLGDTVLDNFQGAGELKVDSPLFADDVLTIDDGGTLNLTNNVAATDTFVFNGAGTLEFSASTSIDPFIVGFGPGDTILFANLPNLTVGYGVQNNLQTSSDNIAFIYSGSQEVAELIGDRPFTDLEPMDKGNGTAFVIDNTTIGLSNPSGNQILWSYIQQQEGGIWYSPYVVPNSDGGVTIGSGVDLGTGPFATPSAFEKEFSNWNTDPNLRAIVQVLGATGSSALTALTFAAPDYGPGGLIHNIAFGAVAGGTQPSKGGDPTLISVSLTQSQVNKLTSDAEAILYKQLTNAYYLDSGGVDFSTLLPGQQTALMDLAYNLGLAKLTGYPSFWGEVTDNNTASWAAAYKNLLFWGTKADLNNRFVEDAQLIGADLNVPKLLPPELIPYTTKSDSDGALVYNRIDVTNAVNRYTGFDPVGNGSYTLTESSGSPQFSSVLLPSEAASLYSVNYDVGGTWSSQQIANPLDVIDLPNGTDGISVALLDANGNPLIGQTDFTFYVTFVSSGNFVGSVNEPSMACFCGATMIAVPQGEKRVEELTTDDEVILFNGQRTAPVVWVRHRKVDCRRHPIPQQVWPVRINAGAFGNGLPRRDLWLSPDHAVYVKDVLIPVKHLTNNVTIVQVPVDEVTYYHIELPQHDVVLAEGLPAESYLDTGDRSKFYNGGGPVAPHPDFAARMWEAEGCAPLIVTGPRLEVARRFVDSIASVTPQVTQREVIAA